MFTRAHRYLIVALVLPLLALKAMLPAGYMSSVVDGELRIVMCSVGLAALSTSDGGDDSPGPQPPSCAFAASAIAVPPPAQMLLAPLVCHAVRRDVTASHATFATALQRCQTARGPPIPLFHV